MSAKGRVTFRIACPRTEQICLVDIQIKGTRGNEGIQLRTNNAEALQTGERRGIRADYPIAWVVGSGNHASAFVVRASLSASTLSAS